MSVSAAQALVYVSICLGMAVSLSVVAYAAWSNKRHPIGRRAWKVSLAGCVVVLMWALALATFFEGAIIHRADIQIAAVAMMVLVLVGFGLVVSARFC
jgi:uncharacterized membrane protein YwzB